MVLPAPFLKRIKDMLGSEYDEFIACYDREPYKGVRLNPLKCDLETLKESVPFELSPTPFSPLCFYADVRRVGQLPTHHSGMFYSQEPSASSAVTLLDPKPGEKILDLCAAPGGKSTQIAGLMAGKGLLWSNEIVKSRANILLSNTERMGVRNDVVSSCHPDVLCRALEGFFDKVLVDAPCSGEGMFRRDSEAVNEWTEDSPASCAARQLMILDSAALAVKPDGVLVYSTCTFSEEENEGVIREFLKKHPEFAPDEVNVDFGRPAFGLPCGRRIFPMDGGEGHFEARLRKTDGKGYNSRTEFRAVISKAEEKAAGELFESLFTCDIYGELTKAGDRLYILPEGLPDIKGLGVLRAGVELGELKNNRIEPSHALFMSSRSEDCINKTDFTPDAAALTAFLSGEEIDCDTKGYTAVCVNGVVTGFGKASNGRLKNKYPKGLRLLG